MTKRITFNGVDYVSEESIALLLTALSDACQMARVDAGIHQMVLTLRDVTLPSIGKNKEEANG